MRFLTTNTSIYVSILSPVSNKFEVLQESREEENGDVEQGEGEKREEELEVEFAERDRDAKKQHLIAYADEQMEVDKNPQQVL